MEKQIEYTIPDNVTFWRYARTLAHSWARKDNDDSLIESSHVQAFSQFLQLAARIEARRCTQGKSFDNETE